MDEYEKLRAELNETYTKDQLREKARKEGFYDIYFSTKPKKELIDMYIDHIKTRNDLESMIRKSDMLKLAKSKGITIKNPQSLTIDDIQFMINSGGYTQKEIEEALRELSQKAKQRQTNEELKWEEVQKLGKILPKIRKKYRKDMSKKRVTKDKVAAVVLGLIDEALFRIGNTTSQERGVYGVSTLTPDMVDIDEENKTLKFRYVGKKEIPQEKEVTDPELFKAFMDVYNYSKKHPCEIKGEKKLFCYSEGGKSEPLRGEDIRRYLEPFGIRKPHRFRAYHASRMIEEGIKEGRTYEDVLKDVSAMLGHYKTDSKTGELVPNLSTAEKSYILPSLRMRYGFGRTAANPRYHRVKGIIAKETRKDTSDWGRMDILNYLKKHPKSRAWKEFRD